MLNKIWKIFGKIFDFWNNLSEETKDNIIQIIVDSFEYIFREFYKNHNNNQKGK